MLVSYEHRFLFIHVPKTGGSSVHQSLKPYAENAERFSANRILSRTGIHVNLLGSYRRKRFRGHSPLSTVKRNLPSDVYSELFRFAFVRNPWDMLVSLYHFIPSRPPHRYAKRVAAMTFAEFVDTWTQRKDCQQKRLLVDNSGQIDVNYVGRFETLNEDFEHICGRIGVTPVLGHANQSRRGDYRQHYSDSLAELVATRLADDISTFGYKFDTLPQVRPGSSRHLSTTLRVGHVGVVNKQREVRPARAIDGPAARSNHHLPR